MIKKEHLREWLVTKCINGERVAIDEMKTFSDKIGIARQNLLRDLFEGPLKSKEKKIVVTL